MARILFIVLFLFLQSVQRTAGKESKDDTIPLRRTETETSTGSTGSDNASTTMSTINYLRLSIINYADAYLAYLNQPSAVSSSGTIGTAASIDNASPKGIPDSPPHPSSSANYFLHSILDYSRGYLTYLTKPSAAAVSNAADTPPSPSPEDAADTEAIADAAASTDATEPHTWPQRILAYLDALSEHLDNEDHDITDVIHHSPLNKLLLFLAMFLLGRHFVLYLRTHFKDHTPWKVATLPLVTPIFIYSSFLFLLSKPIAEISCLGALLGIISVFNINSEASITKGVKLEVSDSKTGAHCTIWFDDAKVTVYEVRERIAQELEVSPSIRVCIESGRGHFIDQLNAPLLPLLTNAFVASDFFGAVTATLRISISELIESNKDEKGTLDRSDSTSKTKFFDILNSKEHIKYKSELQLHARVRSSAVDLVTFSISVVNGFAACAPNHQFPIPNTAGAAIRFHPCNAGIRPTISSLTSIEESVGDNAMMTSGGVTSLVRDGDDIMLECDGKYLSVAKGWWLAWSSTTPRRSGAFTIEVTERVSTSSIKAKISSGINKIKETIQGKKEEEDSKENFLRAGDSFRLRNVKFPEYELGVTSVKIKDNFCYVGLRKVNDSSEVDNEWSMGVRFTVKPNGMLGINLPNLPPIRS